MTLLKARRILCTRQPVWLLKADGTVVAANRLAMWLWKIESEADRLLGSHVFDVICRPDNFQRLALPHSDRSPTARVFQRKAAYAKKAKRQFVHEPVRSAIASLEAAVASRPKLWALYAAAAENQEDEWAYPLVLVPPEPVAGLAFLEFEVSVYRIDEDGEQVGFCPVYQPLRSTRSVVESTYNRAVGMYGMDEYVIPARLTRSDFIMQNPQDESSAPENAATWGESVPPLDHIVAAPARSQRGEAMQRALAQARAALDEVLPQDGNRPASPEQIRRALAVQADLLERLRRARAAS